MTAQLQSAEERVRLEAAADWLLRLRAPAVQAETVSQWLDWCAGDSANQAAFDRMQMLWELSDSVPGLSEQAHGLIAETAEVPHLPDSRARQRPVVIYPALAAGVLLSIAGGVWWWNQSLRPAAVYESVLTTDRGDARSFALPDGSQVTLGGQSAIQLTFDQTIRRVSLTKGEAFFNVHPDKSRAFRVSAGALTVTAIGTAFNVRRDADAVLVTVSEGTVDVRAVNAGATAARDTAAELDVRARSGHQVRYQNGRISSSVDQVDPAIASSFRDGRLQYVDEPLRGVIASVNRYARQDIELDPSLGELHFTGTVFQASIDNWLQGLDAVFPVSVTKEDGKIRISRRF